MAGDIRPFRIGDWNLNPAEGTAANGTQQVRLEPKLMELLVCLAAHAGKVVSKNDLLDAVWPDTHVKEVALSRGISELRRLLGDNARHPHLIETLPKRGYRLIAPVRLPSDSLQSVEPPTLDSTFKTAVPLTQDGILTGPTATVDLATQTTTAKPWKLPFLGLIFLLLGGLLYHFGAARFFKPHAHSIAVLPFLNFSGDSESDYFSRGLTEDIITSLSQLQQLRVVSRTSSMAYTHNEKNIRQIGRELRVASILEGSVRREGQRLRIVAQLIDTATDENLWAETYNRDLQDVFAIQRDVADQIANALRVRLSVEERQRLENSPSAVITAYDLYLQGRSQYQQRRKAANEEAIVLFQQALAIDPDYALAQAGLANAYGLRMTNYDFGEEWLEPAFKAAHRALELDPDLPEAHKALGLLYSYQGHTAQALESYRRALDLRPNYDEAIHNIAFLVYQLGEWDAAGRWQLRRPQLQPRMLW